MGIPNGEWNHPHTGFNSRLFFFPSLWVFIWDAGGCWYSLSWGSACESALHFSTSSQKKKKKIVGKRWLTSSKISNDVDGKPCSRWPGGKRSHVECFQWSACVKERSWVLSQMKDPLRIILHFTAFCIAFYCQLDLQWENYTMLVFCFIMLLFLIFQNIRNFILLYLVAESTSFLEVLKLLPKNRWIRPESGVRSLPHQPHTSPRPWFCSFVGFRSPLTTTIDKWTFTN